MRENRSAASGGRRTNEGVGSSFFRVQTLRPLRSISGVISMSPRGARWPPRPEIGFRLQPKFRSRRRFFGRILIRNRGLKTRPKKWFIEGFLSGSEIAVAF